MFYFFPLIFILHFIFDLNSLLILFNWLIHFIIFFRTSTPPSTITKDILFLHLLALQLFHEPHSTSYLWTLSIWSFVSCLSGSNLPVSNECAAIGRHWWAPCVSKRGRSQSIWAAPTDQQTIGTCFSRTTTTKATTTTSGRINYRIILGLSGLDC